jgi:hypothetical protein
MSVVQHEPELQQKRVVQLELTQSLVSSQPPPFGTSGTQRLPSQCAESSQSESPAQLAAQSGVDCITAPVQRTLG